MKAIADVARVLSGEAAITEARLNRNAVTTQKAEKSKRCGATDGLHAPSESPADDIRYKSLLRRQSRKA